ncbi:MAG: 4Fe-4S dicluster domain-containing protein [Proteobacteria bacterium]|nr:4Fe-4S dicluster domain-containing protein [Pseudomonadota bacterium]
MRIIRIILAALMFIACLGIFLDFTGILPAYLGWVAQIQAIPAILALNIGILAILLALTLLFGRIYCSIICPLGIFQDLWSALRGKKRKYQFREQTKKRRIIRYSVLALFIVLLIVGTSLTAVIEPYSAFGRMAASLFAPVYDAVNNQLASMAESRDSYSFFAVDIWIRGTASFILAIITFIGLAICGVLTGRSYCTNFCPVGTLLGIFARFSLFKVRLDKDKCKDCGSCSNRCKAHCIDVKNHKVDPELCIGCMNCLKACRFDAISYQPSIKNMIAGLPQKDSSNSGTASEHDDKVSEHPQSEPENAESVVPNHDSEQPSTSTDMPHETDSHEDNSDEAPKDGTEMKNNNQDTSGIESGNETNSTNPVNERRLFLAATAAAAGTALCPALSIAGGGEQALANVTRKDPYPRETPITPPGSQSHVNFFHHCTGCMLCVRACHNQVLRTMSTGTKLLYPTLSFEYSYCRPTCNDCSQVCPTGAIRKLTLEQKSSVQIGHAVLSLENCLSVSQGVHCRACGRSCPTGAITFTLAEKPDGKKYKFPVIDPERCIGCGACEYACPARPIAAIHVEGNFQHREI